MSRIAKNPVNIPAGVEVTLNGQTVQIKGPKGSLTHVVHDLVTVSKDDSALSFSWNDSLTGASAQAGTARNLINNMVIGVTEGFTKKLQLVGVGYRASVQGSNVNLVLGFSHPVNYTLPKEVSAECPTQTEIVLTSINKQLLGQVAANIRAYRKPEPYKGKGVRYSDEVVRIKETKKK